MFDSTHPLLPWLATYLLHSTVLLGGALLAARWVRSPGAREVLWKAALVAGFLTAGLHGRLGGGFSIAVLPAFDGPAPPTIGLAAEAIEEVGPAVVATIDPAPEQAIATVASPRMHAEPDGRLAGVLVPVWLLGAGWLVLHLALAYRAQSRRLSTRRAVRCSELRATLHRLAQRMTRLRHVRLTETSALGSPVALGRREICVPRRVRSELTPGEQEGMLAHELAHLARRDPAWLLVAHLIERVFFFQPLNRVVRRRFQEDAEFACDEAAARELAEPVELARCLARVATWIDGSPQPRLAAGMSAEPSGLVGRVERILAPQRVPPSMKRSRLWALGGSGLCIVVLACAGPGVRGAAPEVEEESVPLEAPDFERDLPVRVEVIETGVRIHPETREPYSGTGRFLYDDSRRLRYTVGEAVANDLETLERQLKDVPVEGTRVEIDTRSGVVYEDVVGVVDRIINAGFVHVSFANGDMPSMEAVETTLDAEAWRRRVKRAEGAGRAEAVMVEIVQQPEEVEEIPEEEFIEEEPVGLMWVPGPDITGGPHTDEPIVVHLSRDGTLTSAGQVVAAGREGRLDEDAVRAWLRDIAGAMDHGRLLGRPTSPIAPTGRLRLVGDDRTLFWDVQKIMEWCAAHDVQIYKIELALNGDADSLRPAWLPMDLMLDGEDPPRVEVLVKVRDETPGSRVLQYSVGPHRVESLRELEPRLLGLARAMPDAVITVDARPGTLQSEVLDLVDLVERVGWTKVMYVGAYAWDGR